jgi:2-oxoglutarate ferredoxin oxidoreductase subunit alpha
VIVYNADEVEDTHDLGEDVAIGVPMSELLKEYPKINNRTPNLRMGVATAAVLGAAIGLDEESFKAYIKEGYSRDFENNHAFAKDVYDALIDKIGGKFTLEKGDDKARPVLSGNETIALGGIAGGVDAYFAYPMTPASAILHNMAYFAEKYGLVVVHLENEISVINMAVGATFAGARAMVGSSGGGFALMAEGISLAGISESPVLIYLGQRPGPATGVPTYTEQGDLMFALHAGHGEFERFVACPGTIEEAFYLTAELLDLAWKFQVPTIILTEKHLAESRMSVDIDAEKAAWTEPDLQPGEEDYVRYEDTEDGVSPLAFPPSENMIKWNSYEHDEAGITTEEPDVIIQMRDKRNRKAESMTAALKEMDTVNVFNADAEGPVIVTYGSTLMSVLEAFRAGDFELPVVQPVYLRPFPVWEFEAYKDRDVIVVETSATGIFAQYIGEQTGITPKTVIKRYDGRPFDPVELAEELKEMM